MRAKARIARIDRDDRFAVFLQRLFGGHPVGIAARVAFALTAHALGSQIARIHDAGIDRILNKPIRRDTLLQCLQELASPLSHQHRDED